MDNQNEEPLLSYDMAREEDSDMQNIQKSRNTVPNFDSSDRSTANGPFKKNVESQSSELQKDSNTFKSQKQMPQDV